MSSIICRRCVLPVLTALALAAPVAAQAQSANYAIAGGYQFLRHDGEDLKRGGFGEFEFHIDGPLSLIGQVGSSAASVRTDEQVTSTIRVNVDLKLRVTSYLTGARFAVRRDSKVSPFFDLLAGYVHGSVSGTATTTISGRPFSETESDSSTELGVQVGGGVNVFLSSTAGLQVTVAYLGIAFEDSISNSLRVSAGAVVRF